MNRLTKKCPVLIATCGLIFTIAICLYAKPLWATVTENDLSKAMFGKSYQVTQRYLNYWEKNETPDGRHAGIDYGAPRGAVVRAILGGKIVRVNKDYGLVAIYDGKATVFYLHMNGIKVVENQTIQFGTAIGTVGDVHANGVHLHLEVRPGLQYKAVSTESIPKDTEKLTYNPLIYFGN